MEYYISNQLSSFKRSTQVCASTGRKERVDGGYCVQQTGTVEPGAHKVRSEELRFQAGQRAGVPLIAILAEWKN